MTTISITKLYELLSSKIGKESAENGTNFIEEKIAVELESKSQILATKADLSDAKTDMVKWMFLFWVGQVAVTFGFILLFLKK